MTRMLRHRWDHKTTKLSFFVAHERFEVLGWCLTKENNTAMKISYNQGYFYDDFDSKYKKLQNRLRSRKIEISLEP